MSSTTKLGDFVVWDSESNAPKAVTRDMVGDNVRESRASIRCSIGKGKVKLADGSEVEVRHGLEALPGSSTRLRPRQVSEITSAPKDLIEQLAKDIATIKPASIHQGEGINHWFHATEANRAAYLPIMLTGNIGKPGAGCHGWAGITRRRYSKAASSPARVSKAGSAKTRSNRTSIRKRMATTSTRTLIPKTKSRRTGTTATVPLIVNTPKEGRKVFTGKTHMPTPTKAIFTTNVNLINNAKWAYGMIKNVNPNVELIVTMDTQMTASVEYSDFGLPANSWVEFEDLEITAQLLESVPANLEGRHQAALRFARTTLTILAGIANATWQSHRRQTFLRPLQIRARRQAEHLHPAPARHLHHHRGLQARRHHGRQIWPARRRLMLFRTYPRIPFYEQVHDDYPFYTDTDGCIPTATIPTAIECGENFIVHREGPEATPYLPNVIVSSNPLVRPNDYGIPLNAEHWDERTVRNVKMPWARSEEDEEFPLGKRLPVLLPHAQVAPQRPLVVGECGLASHLELELRRPVSHRQTPAERRRAPDST